MLTISVSRRCICICMKSTKEKVCLSRHRHVPNGWLPILLPVRSSWTMAMQPPWNTGLGVTHCSWHLLFTWNSTISRVTRSSSVSWIRNIKLLTIICLIKKTIFSIVTTVTLRWRRRMARKCSGGVAMAGYSEGSLSFYVNFLPRANTVRSIRTCSKSYAAGLLLCRIRTASGMRVCLTRLLIRRPKRVAAVSSCMRWLMG